MNIDKKYQVFVSSTYTDLLEERQEIMHALLELDCIPAGMELFPASNEDQWSLIKGVIDDCDYYIVVIGGRYGSLSSTGVSYTEMEYRYALETNKPVIGFLHKDPEAISKKHSEKTEEGQKKLNDFRKLVQKKMCKFWTSPQELGSVVSRSLISLQRKFPGTGWVRGNMVPSKDASLEILSLKKEIENLQIKLNEARTQAPEGSHLFAQGEDTIKLRYVYKYGFQKYNSDEANGKQEVTWNEIFYTISPLMIDELSNDNLHSAIKGFLYRKAKPSLDKEKKLEGKNLYDFRINNDDFQTIKVQLKALGLMNKSHKSRSVKDTGTYWALTPYGDEMMTKLRAIKK